MGHIFLSDTHISKTRNNGKGNPLKLGILGWEVVGHFGGCSACGGIHGLAGNSQGFFFENEKNEIYFDDNFLRFFTGYPFLEDNFIVRMIQKISIFLLNNDVSLAEFFTAFSRSF